MSEAGEFKGSGFFRIDRAKALEKLSAFQLERGEQFLLPLARCAMAAGAKTMTVKGKTALKASFTGTPFTRSELEDPYGALFIEDSDPRRRHFAAFLLGALRTRPKEVIVASGTGTKRFRLRTSGLEDETVEPDDRRDVGTSVHVRWGAVGWFKNFGPAKAAARQAWAMTPPGFTVDGAAGGPRPTDLAKKEERGGLTLLVHPPEDPAETRITFCSYGVAVETITTLLPDVQARAWVNDDFFSLTASQGAVLEDARRQKALDAVGAAAAAFLPETALRLAADGRPVPDVLWRAPFLTDASGRALSLATMRGGIPSYSTVRVAGARLAQAVAYCPDKDHLALLKAAFSGSALDVTQLIESLTHLK